jgi:hypothetical protein
MAVELREIRRRGEQHSHHEAPPARRGDLVAHEAGRSEIASPPCGSQVKASGFAGLCRRILTATGTCSPRRSVRGAKELPYPKGDYRSPFTEELAAKFRALSADVLTSAQQEVAIERTLDFSRGDLRGLLDACVGTAR